jgi:hypothetical protein
MDKKREDDSTKDFKRPKRPCASADAPNRKSL